MEVTALSSYEDKEEQFIEQVGQLRQRFFNSISPGGLAGDRRHVVPASGFSISLQEKWTIVKENKDVDLPAHKVMVATVRCEEISNEKFTALSSDEVWLKLSEDVEAGPVPDFGPQLGKILEKYFSAYDGEAMYFDEGVRNAKKQEFKAKALKLVLPTYIKMLGHLRDEILKNFKTRLEQSLNNGEGFSACVQSCTLEFDDRAADVAANQDDLKASDVREELLRHIEQHVSFTRSSKLEVMTKKYEKKLIEALTERVGSLLEDGRNGTWPAIRCLLKQETEYAVSEFSKEVASFELNTSEVETEVQILRDHARNIVEEKARAELGDVLIRMKDRFSTIFGHDKDLTPRIWTEKEDIEAITKDAHSATLKLLSVMAAIRLDEKLDEIGNEKPDKIEDELNSILMDGVDSVSSQSFDPLASTSWNEVSRKDTLLMPTQCKKLWKKFKAETEYMVIQAKSTQEAYKRNKTTKIAAAVIVGLKIVAVGVTLGLGLGGAGVAVGLGLGLGLG